MEQTSGDEQFGKATCKDNSERLYSCEFSPSCCLPCAAKGLRAAGLTDEIGIQRPGKSIRGGQARGHLPTARYHRYTQVEERRPTSACV